MQRSSQQRARGKQQWRRRLEAEQQAERLGEALEEFADESDWQFLIGV